MATPRQKKRKQGQGENVRAATARGFSYKRTNMQERECMQRPKNSCGEELPAGARGFSDMPAASLRHIKVDQVPVAWASSAQEREYR